MTTKETIWPTENAGFAFASEYQRIRKEQETTAKQLVLDFFSANSEAQAKRHLYKNTDCGAWISFHNWGIEIGSIVEGCDFDTAVYPLRYADAFTAADIQKCIDAVENEAEMGVCGTHASTRSG